MPICDEMRNPKDEGAKRAIIKEELVHRDTSTETGMEWNGNLRVRTDENLSPRGSKDKIIKIKSNRSSVRGWRDRQEGR